MDENKFDHDKSPYERPNFPFRCGRGALWRTPCNSGPKVDGSCGGTRDCTPFFKGNRWLCRREKCYGGPCEEGPSPTGECSWQRPPCAPRKTLRAIRGQISFLVVAAIVALLLISQASNPTGAGFVNISDAGPLSKSHKKFTEIEGCASCHAAYGKGPVGWIKAVFTPVDISERCVNCHSFDGPDSIAHNNDLAIDREVRKTECIMCHREHSGQKMSTRQSTSEQCNTCHKNKFESFSKGHPEFPEKYPYFNRNAIKFDHGSHLKKHFENPKFTEKAPSSCTGCHQVTLSDREVRPQAFETICVNCHGSQIKKKDLVLIRLPEFMQNFVDKEALIQACNSPAEEKTEDEFLSVSTEMPALVSTFLLNVPEDDPETYEQPLQELIQAMTEESMLPIEDLVNSQTETPMADKLLTGLNPEVLKRAACSWGLNLEYEPPAEAKFGGWYADMLEVRYKPTGHRDPVAKSWVEFALTVSTVQDDEDKADRAKAMREEIISVKEGVGSCVKCHAVSETTLADGKKKLEIEWQYKEVNDRPHSQYSHTSHIEIMGNKSSCSNCHILDGKAEYMASFKGFDATKWSSNFSSIKRKTCIQCHTESQINQDCQSCHIYHLNPGFKKKMVSAKRQMPEIKK
ncbi:MAG: cytochrome c3 family protein [Nitrospina sp.]|jgi:hypothetical protein|nr:cytochrome c3 family protein [Nitrospina sp.]